MNEYLTKSIFEEPYVSVEGKEKEKGEKNRQQMSHWLSNNITGLISVNQLHQGIKFKLKTHFLLLQLQPVILPREDTQQAFALSLLFFF